MLRKSKSWLLSSVVLGTAVLGSSASVQAETYEQQITRLEADFRKAPRANTLSYLAEAREAASRFDKAEAAWSYLASRFGDEESFYRGHTTQEYALTYRQLAPWMKHRIARKRNLRRTPVSPAEKGRALRALWKVTDPPPVEYLDAYRDIDLDGDGIDERIVYGRSGPLGEGVGNSMAIWRWNGKIYQPIWSTYDKPQPEVTYADHETEWNALQDGFYEIVLRTPGQVQTLYYNGEAFISTIVN